MQQTITSPEQHDSSLVFQQTSGPLPPPADMQRYNDVLPGAAERIFALCEQETRHRQEMERGAQLAQITVLQKQQEFGERQAQMSYDTTRLGQKFGFVAYIACIVGAAYVAHIGSDWQAVAALVGIPSI